MALALVACVIREGVAVDSCRRSRVGETHPGGKRLAVGMDDWITAGCDYIIAPIGGCLQHLRAHALTAVASRRTGWELGQALDGHAAVVPFGSAHGAGQ